MPTWILGIALAAAAGIWILLQRANELCLLRLQAAECRLRRGRAPRRLLDDVGEIARRARLEDVTVRIVVESGAPRALMNDRVPPAVQQQIRNAVGQHRVAHFRTGVGR